MKLPKMIKGIKAAKDVQVTDIAKNTWVSVPNGKGGYHFKRIEGVKPFENNIKISTNDAEEFKDIYEDELTNGQVYFVVYSVGRLTEFDLLCEDRVINRRSNIIETLDEFFERVQFNHQGRLTINIAKDDKPKFLEYVEQIQDNLETI